MHQGRYRILTSALSAALATGIGCADDRDGGGAEGATPAPTQTASALSSEGDDAAPDPEPGETSCEVEPDDASPDETLCFSLQRGWIGEVADATAGGDAPRKGDGERATLTVSGGPDGARQALLFFDTSSIPAGSVVVSARLELERLDRGDAEVAVHRVVEPWREGDIGVDSRVAHDERPSAVLVGASHVTADLTALAQSWVDGESRNFGVLLSSTTGASDFASSEAALRYVRPELSICIQAKGSLEGTPSWKIEELGDIACAGNGAFQDVRVCPADALHASGYCSNTSLDELNCGGCGKACGADELCAFGSCVDSAKADLICGAEGKAVCSDPKTGQATCEDLGYDHDNCGQCGHACLPTQACSDGVCSCGTSPTRALCADTCVSLDKDEANCGACGNVCADGATCVRGTCLAPSNVGLIGDVNARFYDFDGKGGLGLVHSSKYKRRWTHVASTLTTGGTPALFFYARESGEAKLASYASDGTLKELGTSDSFQKRWDIVAAPRMRAEHNLLFYDRELGDLKTVDARADGTFVGLDDVQLPAPNGDASYLPGDRPAAHGWDNIVPVRVSTELGADDAIFVYHQVTGSGRFLVHIPGGGGQWLVVAKHQLTRRWDEVAAGDFDGDGFDDLVFYDQDTGKLKMMFLDASFAAKSFVDLPDQGTSHGARLVAGNFDSSGGTVREDFVLYQTDGGDRFENGRLRMWKDNADGQRVLGYDDGQQLDGWTHVLPVALASAPERQGLLLYSNQHVIDVTYYAMVSMWLAGPSVDWDWSPMLETALRHQNALRKTYAPAGLAFNVRLEPKAQIFQESATYVCGESDRDAVNDWVDAHVPTTTLPILLATESDNGTGCSGQKAHFVREKYFYDTSGKRGYLLEHHSAHEMGHYFGLGHAHIGGPAAGVPYDDAHVEKKLGKSGDVFTLDTDSRWKDSWERVYDSPPTLTEGFFWELMGVAGKKSHTKAEYQTAQSMRCPTTASSPSLTFQNGDGDDVELVLYPPTVSGYGACPGSRGQGFGRLSRDEIRVVRHTLYDNRKALIGL
ncbi:MAG: DNRLRE domain-containing protein [Myxococcota bacterium]